MIYADLIKESINLSELEIIIETKAKLTTPIRFLDESKKTKDSNDKKPDQYHAMIRILADKSPCKIFIRNRAGGGRSGQSSKHDATVKFKLNDSTEVPVFTNGQIDSNDSKLIREIKTKHPQSLSFVTGNEESIRNIWESTKIEEILNIMTSMIEADYNKKYKPEWIGEGKKLKEKKEDESYKNT